MPYDTPRQAEILSFLNSAGWRGADLAYLQQDASTRRYARLSLAGRTAILMDAPLVEDPPCHPDMDEAARIQAGWNASTRLAASRVDAFVLIAAHLRSIGLRPPHIFAHHTQKGLALLEDFGEGREFARLIERGEADEVALYTQAAKDLALLHAAPIPGVLHNQESGETWPIQRFDALALRTNSDLFIEWLPRLDPRMQVSGDDLDEWRHVQTGLIAEAETFPRTFTLRDYHAENLLWLPEGRIGLLDFQDAVIGWDAWDMVMLTQDARRPVSAEATQGAVESYIVASGIHSVTFQNRISVIGTLNALRIVGVFSRLIVRDNKPRYLQFMPRQQALLAQNLSHPATTDMGRLIRRIAPFIFEAQA